MKRFLLSLMVLAMFTPGLACAKLMNAAKPQMTQGQMAKDMPCCPKSKTTPDADTMLFKDCMKVDLSQANNAPLLKKVDLVKPVFSFVLLQAAHHDFSSIRVRAARAPPPERTASLSATKLPIFLATQRLRI